MSGNFSGTEQGMWRVRGNGDKRNPYLGRGSSTGFSSAQGGNVTIDPSIRSIQEQSLSKSSNLYNALGSQAESLMGNQSDYIKARVSPLEQEYTTRHGSLERNLGQRGLSGSSFGQQSLDSFASEKQRELGNARSLATQESLGQLAQVRGMQANQIGMDLGVARERFMMELQALGLGENEVAGMMRTFEEQAKRQGGFQPYQSSHSGSGGGGVGGGNSTPNIGGCWVAEELYGVDSIKTHKLRAYFRIKMDESGITGNFSRLYRKHGKKWAQIVKDSIPARIIAHAVWGFYWIIAKGK